MESPRGLRDPALGSAAQRIAEADLVLLAGKRLDFTLGFGRGQALAPDAAAARDIARYFNIATDVFLRMIKMVVAPLVFATLVAGIASMGLGQNGYRRTLLADSPALGNGNLLYALELFHNDGPFTHGDDYRKINGVLRYGQGNEANGYNVTAMAYRGRWNATDQIPKRAVDAGALGTP